MKKKSIIISGKHHKELTNLCEAYGSSLYKLVEEMIIYFKRTGINPKDYKNDNPSILIKTVDKRIVSYFTVQERDILKPMRLEVSNNSKKNLEEIKKISTQVDDLFQQVKKEKINSYDELKTQIKNQKKAFYVLAQLIDQKNKSGIVQSLNKIFSNANK